MNRRDALLLLYGQELDTQPTLWTVANTRATVVRSAVDAVQERCPDISAPGERVATPPGA